MRIFTSALFLSSVVSIVSAAQTASPGAPVTLRTGTQLVIVDVSVEDRAGRPVHGLKAADFVLTESKSAQVLKAFEEHSAAQAAEAVKATPLPPLPPGVFTDYTPAPESPVLNVLLLDTLNTPMTAQGFVRSQLQQFVKHAQPGTRIAIFGLAQRLIILQGFTSDPVVLRNAVEHKLIPRSSVLLDDPAGTNTGQTSLSDAVSDLGDSTVAANLAQFEAETQSYQTQLRTRYTLDAFNALAHYLVQFPGRKNLIWFSGSFPLNIMPDADLENPFGVVADSMGEFRDTTNLLNRARVAVYPIDARGLQTLPMFDASNSGSRYVRNPTQMTRDIGKWSSNNAQEHVTMEQMAADTGGRAFYNTNGLAGAVAKAIDAGSNFYTLAYSPSNRKWDGAYRSIHLSLAGPLTAAGYKLLYRHGYYADDPNHRGTGAISSPAAAGEGAGMEDPYQRAAMQRAAPTPSEILFKVRVLPDSTTTTDTVLAHNTPSPNGKLKPPFRVYDVDYAALATDIELKPDAENRRHGGIQFLTFVYDADGTLLNWDGRSFALNLTPAAYAQLVKEGIKMRLQVYAPARGESFLRIAVHDTSNANFGVIEIPTSTVSRLSPPPDAPPAASAAGETAAEPRKPASSAAVNPSPEGATSATPGASNPQ